MASVLFSNTKDEIRNKKKTPRSSESAERNTLTAGSDPSRRRSCRRGGVGFSPLHQGQHCKACVLAFSGKPVQDVFSGVAQFIQDCSHSRAPVLPRGSGGTAQVELQTPSRRGWDTPEAPADVASHSPRASTSFFRVLGLGFFWLGFLIANKIQVTCKTVRQVLNDYGHPSAHSNLVRELCCCCCCNISGQEFAGSQA